MPRRWTWRGSASPCGTARTGSSPSTTPIAASSIRATSTKYAPWHIIPADNKWASRVAVARIISRTLKDLKLAYPEVSAEQKQALEEARLLLEAEK